jgi:hypothetical protein
MDIFINRNNFQTLMDVVITNLTCIDMVQQTSTITTLVMMMVVQEKTQSYVEQALDDDFIPLLWVVSIGALICLVFLMDGFLSLIFI